MNVKLKILRKVLEEAINNIDAGNSNHSDDELDLLLRQYVFLNMLPLLLFIYLIQKIYYFSLFFFN